MSVALCTRIDGTDIHESGRRPLSGVIWFNDDGEPYECWVNGIEATDNKLTVLATIKDSLEEVTCESPFELGASNIDWLNEMYEAAKLELEGTKNVEP